MEIYELYPAHFLSAPGLRLQACLKKTRVKIELLTDIDMLLIIKMVLEEAYVNQYIDTLKQIINI